MLREEGLEERWKRHERNSLALIRGLEAMGLEVYPKAYRCPALTAVSIPDGVDDQSVRRRLREEYGITISGGLGALKGKVWRIGLMGDKLHREERDRIPRSPRAGFEEGGLPT